MPMLNLMEFHIMSSPSNFSTKYPPRFYEIVREALKDEPDSVVLHIPDDVLHKFARLIAKECADIAMKQLSLYQDN